MLILSITGGWDRTKDDVQSEVQTGLEEGTEEDKEGTLEHMQRIVFSVQVNTLTRFELMTLLCSRRL